MSGAGSPFPVLEVSILQHAGFGLVAFVAVGATLVGSVELLRKDPCKEASSIWSLVKDAPDRKAQISEKETAMDISSDSIAHYNPGKLQLNPRLGPTS